MTYLVNVSGDVLASLPWQVFEKFLRGTTLEECYAAVGEVANQWLDVLYSRGGGVDDDELMELISQNKTMSQTLEDYGTAKVKHRGSGLKSLLLRRCSLFMNGSGFPGTGEACLRRSWRCSRVKAAVVAGNSGKHEQNVPHPPCRPHPPRPYFYESHVLGNTYSPARNTLLFFSSPSLSGATADTAAVEGADADIGSAS